MRERESSFIGLREAEELEFTTTRDESTRCGRCKNDCLRTFVDLRTPRGEQRRYIIATCEKGEVENEEEVKDVRQRLAAVQKANPNLVEFSSIDAFRSFKPRRVRTLRDEGPEPAPATQAQRRRGLLARFRSQPAVEEPQISGEVLQRRREVRIGIPRALSMYSLAPLFRSYFEALGVDLKHITYSGYTDAKLWTRGSRRGSIDQCFPSKVAIAHVHDLIFEQPEKKKPDLNFFPIIRRLPPEMANAIDSAACPTVSITPDVIRAAYTKEGDVFAQQGMRFVTPSLDMSDRRLLATQMHDCFRDLLGVTAEENEEALDSAFEALREFQDGVRARGRAVLEGLEREDRVGVVLLGRPYHNDPGLNHEIMAEIQKRGYPILSIDSLPQDEDILERLFGDDVRAGVITDPLDVGDVWKNVYSENTSKKIWAAKYVARHPNLVAVDLSSFKCGHDAPVHDPVKHIIEASGTPYFTFHDIDENKATGSITIRIETIDYFLQLHQERLRGQGEAEREIVQKVEAYRAHLRRSNQPPPTLGEGGPQLARGGAGTRTKRHRAPGQARSGSAPMPVTDLLSGFNLGAPPRNGDGPLADHRAYDRIRAEHVAELPLVEEPANAAVSCTIAGSDFLSDDFAGGAGGGCGESGGCGCGGSAVPAFADVQLVDLDLAFGPKAVTRRICT